MAEWRLRPFRPGDLAGLLDAFAASAPVDAPSAAAFTEKVLLDVGFRPGGLQVATAADGTVVGACYAVGAVRPGVPVPGDGGWLTFFFVHPAWRRRGIGGALLDTAAAWLAERGAAWVEVLAYPPAYFVPGVDADRYPEAMRLLAGRGFAVRDSPVAMDACLATYRTPPEVAAVRAAREAAGYRFGPATAGDLPEVVAFAATRLAPDWGDVVRDGVLRTGRADRVLLAREPAGAVVGFATYGSYASGLERFGPFGVDETRRGAKLGEILLHLTMTRMRAEGAHGAWFLWTGEDSPAGHLYRKAGYRVTRRFHVLRKPMG